MSHPRVLVVHRRSAYTDFIANQTSRIKKLIESGDPLVASLVSAHDNHIASMETVEGVLRDRGVSATWRHDIGDLNPDTFDLVVTVGGDGTVLHASHAIEKTAVLAVNSSPSTSVGFFTCTDAAHFGEFLDRVLDRRIQPRKLSRMEVRVNDRRVTDLALNDVLFCHDCPASTTRYVLGFNGTREDQLSSGVWVSTAAGSTAAIKSAGGKAMAQGSRRLQFVVREPFPNGGAETQRPPRITEGFIAEGDTLSIASKTEAARLYVDGPHVVFSVDFGDMVSFSKSGKPLSIFGGEKKGP